MIRPLLQVAFWLTLLFLVITALIRSQPYDDSALRTFLNPSGCTMPCFIGIQPGITTCDEAVAILEAHQWVGELKRNECSSGISPGFVSWTWNGQQPTYLPATPRSLPSIGVDDGVVQEIKILTSISLGKVWLLYGAPNRGIMDVFAGVDYTARILNVNSYVEIGLQVTSYAPCPTSFATFFNASTQVLFSSNLQSSRVTPKEEFADLLQYHNHLCRG